MAGDNGCHNGSAVRPNRAPELTLEQLQAGMRSFISAVKGATVSADDETDWNVRFPEFCLTATIRDKMATVVRQIGAGDIKGASETFHNVVGHFDNQRAAFARNLVYNFRIDHEQMVKRGYPGDLLANAQEVITAYNKLVSCGHFDLGEALKLYWTTHDALDAIDEEFKNRKVAEIERQRQTRVAAEQENRARAQERCTVVATELASLLK